MEKNLKKIALIGQPNVGKSSLFNRIANKRIAIVSDVSGTTRDVRRHEIEIIDRSALLLDTGGIDETNDEIFSNVKKKAVKTAKEADIILFIVDGKNMGERTPFEGMDPDEYNNMLGPDKPKPRGFAEPKITKHIFKANIPASAKDILVNTYDPFGNKFTATQKVS